VKRSQKVHGKARAKDDPASPADTKTIKNTTI